MNSLIAFEQASVYYINHKSIQLYLMSNSFDYLLKYILIGDSRGVGKSCLLNRFVEGKFKAEHDATLGVEFGCKNITLQALALKIQIWDTAGQESFKSITRSYYKGSVAAFLIFDITRKESFDNIEKWLIEVRNYSHKNIQVVLIGNKTDLQEKRKIEKETVEAYAKSKNFLYFQTSALSGSGVEDAFLGLTGQIVKKIVSKQIDPESEESSGIKIGKKRKEAERISSSTMQISHSDQRKQKSQTCKC